MTVHQLQMSSSRTVGGGSNPRTPAGQGVPNGEWVPRTELRRGNGQAHVWCPHHTLELFHSCIPRTLPQPGTRPEAAEPLWPAPTIPIVIYLRQLRRCTVYTLHVPMVGADYRGLQQLLRIRASTVRGVTTTRGQLVRDVKDRRNVI